MMIDKRLLGLAPESKKYIAGNVVLQWLSLAAPFDMYQDYIDGKKRNRTD